MTVCMDIRCDREYDLRTVPPGGGRHVCVFCALSRPVTMDTMVAPQQDASVNDSLCDGEVIRIKNESGSSSLAQVKDPAPRGVGEGGISVSRLGSGGSWFRSPL